MQFRSIPATFALLAAIVAASACRAESITLTADQTAACEKLGLDAKQVGELLNKPLYNQAPEMTSAHRGILDLLAVDFQGRLAIVELKASEDLHLPLQALDYWMRVKWHLERGDFARAGYFPGLTIRPEPPRLILVAPASHFHPANETILRFFSSEVAVERIGLGLEWRREVRVAFRQCSSGN